MKMDTWVITIPVPLPPYTDSQVIAVIIITVIIILPS